MYKYFFFSGSIHNHKAAWWNIHSFHKQLTQKKANKTASLQMMFSLWKFPLGNSKFTLIPNSSSLLESTNMFALITDSFPLSGVVFMLYFVNQGTIVFSELYCFANITSDEGITYFVVKLVLVFSLWISLGNS